MSEPADITDRLRVMSAILEREVTTDNPGKLEALKLLLRDAELEIVNLRLRLRHAYDRENEAREVMMPTARWPNRRPWQVWGPRRWRR